VPNLVVRLGRKAALFSPQPQAFSSQVLPLHAFRALCLRFFAASLNRSQFSRAFPSVFRPRIPSRKSQTSPLLVSFPFDLFGATIERKTRTSAGKGFVLALPWLFADRLLLFSVILYVSVSEILVLFLKTLCRLCFFQFVFHFTHGLYTMHRGYVKNLGFRAGKDTAETCICVSGLVYM
jgi:hypothetical protein